MTIDAVLFDIDGTLVDSNYLHIDAWQRACESVGRPVDAWRVHRAIGMDSSGLLEQLLGNDAERLGGAASEAHAARYRELAGRLRPLPGARELIGGLRSRGVAVVLATSAPQEELDLLLDVLGLGADDLPSTNADDVDEAKPHPGIVQVALQLADVAADRAVFVGDSVWDMVAARRAGVAVIGVRSGGIGADELIDAGAWEVVDDVAELDRRGHEWPPSG
jgi:HAD superfamily hydrolase (TIGR01509 family)